MATSVTICLWFDTGAEDAARYYCSVIDGAELGTITTYPEGSYGGQDGQVMGAEFTLDGTHFYLLNGGPHFRLTEAASIQLRVDTQEEIDRYWDALIADGGEPSECGWLKDRWGLSWQVTPRRLEELFASGTEEQRVRVNAAMLKMQKFDLAELEAAAAG
ncbi:MAG: VOC family protein [bacterium]|nr:VOC family protein [bacterium]